MDIRQFYWQCFRRAWRGKLLWAEGISGVLTVFAVPLAYLWRPEDSAMNWIPLAIFGAVFAGTVIIGFCLAPYWIYKEIEVDRNNLKGVLYDRVKKQEALKTLADLRKEGVEARELAGSFRLVTADVRRRMDYIRKRIFETAAIISPSEAEMLKTIDTFDPKNHPQFVQDKPEVLHFSELIRRIADFIKRHQ